MSEVIKPKISLLLLTFDRYQMTKYTLTNLLAKAGYSDFELLILDNGSADSRTTCLTAEKDFPAVQSGSLITEQTNIGIAAGYNKLLKKAKGDYIVFLTNDILLGDNWLVDLLHYNNEVDKAGLTTIFLEGEKGYFTKQLTDKDDFIYVWKPTNNITSGVSMISRLALEAVGGFDETLGIYGKERDQYAHRLSMLGYNNFYIPGQCSTHLGRDLNEDSDYRHKKDKALQLSSNRYKESIKSKDYHIAL